MLKKLIAKLKGEEPSYQEKRFREELTRAGLFNTESDYNGMIGKAVMELYETFQKQGHSGFSAQMVATIFADLVKGDPLTPLTGANDEWVEVGSGLYQNKRVGAVFQDERVYENRPYYLDAIYWRDENGATFTGTVQGFKSAQPIRFPFMPKTFIIDTEKDPAGNHRIKNWDDLQSVWEYYQKPMGVDEMILKELSKKDPGEPLKVEDIKRMAK